MKFKKLLFSIVLLASVTSLAQLEADVRPGGSGVSEDLQFSAAMLKKFLRQYEYPLEGRRDPFQPVTLSLKNQIAASKGSEGSSPLQPLQRFDLDQLDLLGIIWNVNKPKAMIKDPSGKVHFVSKEAKVGRNNGYIARIREGELVIVESFKDRNKTFYQTRVVKIKK